MIAGVVAGPLASPASALELPSGGLAPTVRYANGVVRWNAVGVEDSYRIAISDAPRGTPGRSTTYITVPREPGEAQSFRPTEPLGDVVYIGVSADGGIIWSENEGRVRVMPERAVEAEPVEAEEVEESEVPSAPPPPAPQEPPGIPRAPANEAALALAEIPSKMIIGTNDGSGWGATAAKLILAGHITWDRFSIKAWAPAVQTSLNFGFNVLGIANAVNDSTPLSAVEPLAWGNEVASELAAHPSIKLAEAGNESYLKGDIANPAQYARMYMAAINAMKARSIKTPLLFNMIGDYPYGTWSSPKGWSEDAKGGGWLRDAVKAVPGLPAAILANGISIHPYGALGENKRDSYGVNAAAADERVAQEVLGAIPPFYITEFGYDLGRCGRDLGACTRLEQATKLRAAYKVFESDPHIAGIWWYQSHDDSTGKWGFMNNNNTKRPSFNALAGLAKLAGQ